ncbi:MAG: carboxymuconolactone decarboxylase family protein [Deltaproteobacteria bacterium]|jgi:AhpD family alkylhydroperoxidase|nr:carboxymuconolactone decarboxylase family protein [Deltaproteobacteria bacterium]MBW2000961.1 carboxymuconolactone decarboxylase family protein [Deltaproteobacteria bacterium]
MVESQIELEKNRVKQRDRFGELLPGLKGALDGLKDEVYKDGALSVKIKRLMSLAIGLRAGCRSCILSQTMSALEAGATKDEILETITVGVSMSGTTGIGESLRVIQLLDELGKL